MDLMSSSSSCSKHRVERRTLETQVKIKIPLVGKLIAYTLNDHSVSGGTFLAAHQQLVKGAR